MLLAVSAFAKLADMQGFVVVVDSYRALPAELLDKAAWLLAFVELALSALLVFGPTIEAHVPAARAWVAARFAAVFALHLMYLVWLALAYLRGLDIPNCGCFGVYWPRPLTAYSLLEDAVLLLLSARLWYVMHQRQKVYR